MYLTHCTMVIHSHAKQSVIKSKGIKSWGLNTKPCHKPYKFDLEVKGQHLIRMVNVLETSSHGDRPMCQIWYANVKANGSYRPDTKTCQKPYKFYPNSKFKVVSGSWLYVIYRLMVITHVAKYGRPMSIQKKSYSPDTKTCQKPYKFVLKFKVQGPIWIINVRVTSSYCDTPMCQIWKANVNPNKKLWAGHKYMSKTL